MKKKVTDLAMIYQSKNERDAIYYVHPQRAKALEVEIKTLRGKGAPGSASLAGIQS